MSNRIDIIQLWWIYGKVAFQHIKRISLWDYNDNVSTLPLGGLLSNVLQGYRRDHTNPIGYHHNYQVDYAYKKLK